MARSHAFSGELDALDPGTFFTKARRGERLNISEVDAFFGELEEELFFTEGNQERSLALATRIRSKEFTQSGRFALGYVAQEVRDSLHSLAEELSADPAGPRNALVLALEAFHAELEGIDARDREREGFSGAGGDAQAVAGYKKEPVRAALSEALVIASHGDNHDTHRQLRAWRAGLTLPIADAGQAYPKDAVDFFLASLVSSHCSSPLSDDQSFRA